MLLDASKVLLQVPVCTLKRRACKLGIHLLHLHCALLPLEEAKLLLECVCDIVCKALLPRGLHVAGVQVLGDGGEVDGQLFLVRGQPLLQHQSEVGSNKVLQPDAAHDVFHHVEPGCQLPHRLKAGLELGDRDAAILVGVKFVKERPQHVRFDALLPAKGKLPLVKRQVTGAINVGAGECGRGVHREESLQDGHGLLAAQPDSVALARVDP